LIHTPEQLAGIARYVSLGPLPFPGIVAGPSTATTSRAASWQLSLQYRYALARDVIAVGILSADNAAFSVFVARLRLLGRPC
jgi:hypothetical protein